MTDIVTRLRRWTHDVNAAPASDLMDQAANEIERLRLTDAEREALSSVLARLCCEMTDDERRSMFRICRTQGDPRNGSQEGSETVQ
jgi:hypothetical protein